MIRNNPPISFVGYSGHAYVCIETALKMQFVLDGYYDVQEQDLNPYNINYLGSEDSRASDTGLLFISIGDNKIRLRVYNKLKAKSIRFTTLIHPKSIVSDTAVIEENVLISAGAILNAHTKIQTGCIVNTGAIIEHECVIHSFAHIAPGVVLAGNVKVGERTFIGANSVVKQGVKIGNDVIIGAGSVVISDIPDNVTYVGNPAKKLIK